MRNNPTKESLKFTLDLVGCGCMLIVYWIGLGVWVVVDFIKDFLKWLLKLIR